MRASELVKVDRGAAAYHSDFRESRSTCRVVGPHQEDPWASSGNRREEEALMEGAGPSSMEEEAVVAVVP